jgi:type II secretory pathway pseudopilin PulG
MARAARIVTSRFGIMGDGFTPVELIVVFALVGTLLITAVVPLMSYKKSRKVDEAIGFISSIIVSQEIEKAGKRLEYYEAVGPNAHEIIGRKGIEISKAVYFSYETFRTEGYFIVVATALAKSRMKGRIIYESKTGKWVGTEDIRQEWVP